MTQVLCGKILVSMEGIWGKGRKLKNNYQSNLYFKKEESVRVL